MNAIQSQRFEEILDIKEASAYAHIGINAMGKMFESGEITAFKCRGKWITRREWVDAWTYRMAEEQGNKRISSNE